MTDVLEMVITMNRHFFISDDLEDLDRIEGELERSGILKPQIHVLSKGHAAIEPHKQLHNIESVLKHDAVHGTIMGAFFGAFAAGMLLIVAYLTHLPETYTWQPFYFLAIAVFWILAWSGGFYGIPIPNHEFCRFQNDLDNGKHIFIVDVKTSQENIIKQMCINHPCLLDAGSGNATPRWIIMAGQSVKNITSTNFP